MRQQDIEKLKEPYSPPEDSQDLEVTFSRRLGVDIPEILGLHAEISKDFVGESTFGIGWWAPHLGTKRRILAGHHLCHCVQSIGTNLVEAKLHHLEAIGSLEKESDFLANVITQGPGGQLRHQFPRRTSPWEYLPNRLAVLHIVGFFRALVGALDCLGASIVGVLALKADLRLAGFLTTRDQLDNASHHVQVNFREKFSQAITDSGPAGWIEWLFDYRNMSMHCGRRVSMMQLQPRLPQMYGPDGRIILRSEEVAQLPREPYLSEIEALLDSTNLGSGKSPVLTESADRTMQGFLKSSLDLVCGAGSALVESWRARRENPSLLPQPQECWNLSIVNGVMGLSNPRRATGFPVYDPDRLPYAPIAMIGSPDVVLPLRTAALDDSVRNRWKTFD